MKSITANPYRVLGILAGTSLREQESKTKRLLKYLEVEEELPIDYHFYYLGDAERNIETIQAANSHINLDKDKLIHSLFWFIGGNKITDEPVFDLLKEGDETEAIEIWTNLAEDENGNFKAVSKKNFSAFLNLSNLYLYDYSNIKNGLKLKMEVLDSDFYKDYVELIVDKTFSINQEELQLIFLNEFKNEIKDNVNAISDFEKYLFHNDFIAKKSFLKDYAVNFISEIEERINNTKHARKINKAISHLLGKTLSNEYIPKLKSIRECLDENDIRYTNVADKLAEEILQCGIDYFLYCRDTDRDPGLEPMNLLKQAKVIAKGQLTKQRINENLAQLQEWIDDKPKRDKEAAIVGDLTKLKSEIDRFEHFCNINKITVNCSEAIKYLANCKPLLLNLKNTLGVSDELYLNISTRIASDAQQLCIRVVNKMQELLGDEYGAARGPLIDKLKFEVLNAWDVTVKIDSMHLRNDFKIQHDKNRSALFSLKQQVEQISTQQTQPRVNTSSNSGGCYIATMAYGSYEHPQVLELRAYRDNVLAKTRYGRFFIRTYYFVSPKLVSILKNNSYLNSKIRMFLDKFIIKLKSKK